MIKTWDPADILTKEEIDEVIKDYTILNGPATENELIEVITETAIDKLIDRGIKDGLIEVVKKDGKLCLKLTEKGRKF